MIFGILAAAAVVVALTVGGSDDDDDDQATPTTPTTEPAPISIVTIAVTTLAPTTAAPTTTESPDTVVDTSAPRTTVATTVPDTVAPAPTVPPTPINVTTPSERIGPGSIPCPLGPDGLYVPVANCFVPLPNGNIVADFNGALVCADPPGTTLLETATPFLVGFNGDPLAVVADGVVLPRCTDLSYAKNVMVEGAGTFAGLCGAPNVTMNENATRCFAQNPSTGSMVAVVAAFGASRALTALCYTADAPPAPLPLTWTVTSVDSTWTVASITFDAATQQFVATATIGNISATTSVACT